MSCCASRTLTRTTGRYPHAAFGRRGIGGDWELLILDHWFDAGLDLTGLSEIQVWISYQFLR